MDFICFRDSINIIFLCLPLFWNWFASHFLEICSICTPASYTNYTGNRGRFGAGGGGGTHPRTFVNTNKHDHGLWLSQVNCSKTAGQLPSDLHKLGLERLRSAQKTHTFNLERPHLASGVVCQIPFEILGSGDQWEKTTHSRVRV